VSDDGRQVATLEWGSRALKVWNLETSELTESWTLGGQLGRSVVFSPDGRWLAASTRGIRSGQLAIIDLATGKMKGQIAIGKGTHMFSPDGERVIVAASTGTFRDREALLSMWDVASLKEEFKESFQGMPGVRAAALSSDGKMLAVAGISYDNSDESTNVVVLWDVTRKKTRLIIDLGEKVPSQLAMSPDGRSLVTLPWRGSELRVWDPRDGRLRETIQVRQPSHLRLHVQDIEFARDSRHLAAAMGNGTVYLLRIQEPSTAVQLKSTELSSPQSPEALPRDIWKDLIGKPALEFEGVRSWPPRIPGTPRETAPYPERGAAGRPPSGGARRAELGAPARLGKGTLEDRNATDPLH
jgi:WD40 repeat protein